MIKLLFVLLMFGWAGCTQQEEREPTTETELSDRYEYAAHGEGFLGYVTGRERSKFDPTKHYIISVDTVGFERIIGNVPIDTIHYGGMDFDCYLVLIHRKLANARLGTNKKCFLRDEGGFEVLYCNDSIWQPTLDTTWANKEHLLVTPEEAKKLRSLLE